jgi:uncharacterized protein YqgQ
MFLKKYEIQVLLMRAEITELMMENLFKKESKKAKKQRLKI